MQGLRGVVGVSIKRWISRHRDGDVQVGSGPGRREDPPQRTETIPEAPPRPTEQEWPHVSEVNVPIGLTVRGGGP